MLYKYLSKDNFNKLINDGSIRIGTLHGYKRDEAGKMVKDTMEGSKRFSGSYLTMNKEMAEKSSFMRHRIAFEDGATVNYFCVSNCTIMEPDYYIFSMSTQYSEDVHRKWNKEEGYDCCYKINFPKTFFKHVTQALNAIIPVRYLGLHQVHYYNEKRGMDLFDPKESFPAFALKDHAEFADQTEIRAVWQPISTNDIESKILSNRLLGSYVKRHRSLT